MDTRSLTEIDVPLVAKWNVQLHEDEHSTAMTIEAAEERYRRWLEDKKFDSVIFVIDEKPIGYITFEHRNTHPDFRSSEAVYVRQFFIARESRRMKYGTQAFNLFLDKLVPANVKVFLNVKSSNPAGQSFWEALGFTQENIAYELLR